MPLAHRYALYLAPTGPWREFGSRWLGRCADTGAALPPLPGQPKAARDWTEAPRHYGLHATLKPPFRLRPGATPGDVDAAARQLASADDAFGIQLECEPLRGFLGRRQPHALSLEQQAMLARWRYPYVFATFTFHITLTGKLDGAALEQARAGIATFADPLRGQPMAVPGVSVYVQPQAGADFIAARHYHFDGGHADAAGAAYLEGPAAA